MLICLLPSLTLAVFAGAASRLSTDHGRIISNDPALSRIVPSGARIEKVASGFVFIEGPVWVGRDAGYLLFSDVRGNAIWRWSARDQVTPFRKPVFSGEHPSGRPVGSNGLTLDGAGRLLACEHGNRRISRTEEDGSITVLVDRYRGKRLNSPNDLVYRSDGSLYFTDPPYGLLNQDDHPEKELPFNGVFRLTTGGELQLLVDDLTRPNGLAFSPDERILYIAHSDPARKLWMRYEVRADGGLANGRVFYDVTEEKAEGLPDGLKVDREGNLYCTGPGGIWIFSPQGKHLGTIQPSEIPANCAWGGGDGKTLYMTARTGLYRVRLNIEGIRPGQSR